MMQIGCTKNLQDELKIKAEKPVQDDDFYSWSANVMKGGRMKIVVVVHDATRFSFVLSGLKAKDFKVLDQLIVNGIRTSLRSAFVSEETIEKYLAEAGKIQFTKTKSPAHVGGLKQPYDMAYFWHEFAAPDRIYQPFLTDRCNYNLVSLYKRKNVVKPIKEMTNVMKAKYGEHAISIVAADITVKLTVGKHQLFRRIQIPLREDFRKLHRILQVAFGGRFSRQYGFVIPLADGYSEQEAVPDNDDALIVSASKLKCFDFEMLLAEYLKELNKFVYNIRGVDQVWKHEITVNQIIDNYAQDHPKCVMAVGDHVPELFGDSSAYERFLEVRENPNHEEYEETMDWVKRLGYKVLDVDDLNRSLSFL